MVDVLERLGPKSSTRNFDEGWAGGKMMCFMGSDKRPKGGGKRREVPWMKNHKDWGREWVPDTGARSVKAGRVVQAPRKEPE